MKTLYEITGDIKDINTVLINVGELDAIKATSGDLLKALQVLYDEADSFSVSGVYFNEKCMGHKGLDLAEKAIKKATGEA